MLTTVPAGRPAPRVAETPGVAVTVAVVVEVTVVVRTVDVIMVCGGLLMTNELVPPKKLKIVPTDSYTVLKYAGYSMIVTSDTSSQTGSMPVPTICGA